MIRVKLPPKQWAALRRLALTRRKSNVSKIVSRAVASYLKRASSR